jgi:myo-inositol-1(or 4)-monophosphatase
MALKSPVINVMEAAARKASRGLIRDFGEIEHLQVSKKGPSDFVSAADLRVERILREELSKARPGWALVTEEHGGGIPTNKEDVWIADPIDGTTNFLHGIPHFCLTIAHWRRGEIVAGIVYQPIGDELFWAEKGMGTYHNRRRLRVSARQNLGDALIATGLPFRGKEKHPRYMNTLAAVVPEVAGVRRFGAAALDLAWVAAGRFDGFWERNLSSWDLAAGLVLLREAGGFATDVDGGEAILEKGSIIAGNEEIQQALLALLKSA